MQNKALRFNEGKQRLELVPTSMIEGVGSILTYGANKYTVKDENGKILVDSAGNWRSGLTWSGVLSSMKRHIAAFERGEDFDIESGLYHIDHAMCNLAFIKEFYKTHPELDDRNHTYLKPKRIALDVDDVVCSWVGEWCKLHNIHMATSWYFQYGVAEKFEEMCKAGTLDKFYSDLPPLLPATNLPFEPICYISHCPVDKALTEAWLEKHGFPLKPVYITPTREDKVKICKDNNIDYFVDDNYDTFVEMNKAGVCCFLMDTPHNQRYEVGYKRIKDFADFKTRFL